ncbi:hypothetical protein DESUT3_08970 [Desulfuromonas versatilis]|uniref:histidine kinase n=1 Tax=Desulfuromonas versatilis TaxID=2802975 RepID=A0ABN6DUN5_9BACT|nr:PAS domain S-box protein [Desulfuromonas versatilis]BCR03828.1 hypothetical protein DESUT3_08970 [Desulfuromonas versatilis]
MKKAFDVRADYERMRRQLIGLGEGSFRKSHYPQLQQRLAELERFRSLLDHSNDAIFLLEAASGKIVDFNLTACRLCACERELLSSSKLVDFAHLSGVGSRQTAPGRELVTTTLATRDGGEIPVEITLSEVTFDGVAYQVAVVRDIARRVQARQELESHQVLLNSVLNNSDNAFLALDEKRRVIYYNEHYLRLYPFGREFMDASPSIEQLIRQACRIGIYPCEQVEELIARRIQQMESSSPVNRVETPRLDGVDIEAIVTKLPGGGFLVTFRDVTERRLSEAAVRESEERFRSVFEISAAGILILSPEGRIVQANPAFCRFVGYSRQDLLDHPLTELSSFDDRSSFERDYQAVVRGRSPVATLEKRFVCKDGSIVWGHTTVACVVDTVPRPLYCIAVIQDVTDRKKAEEALRESEERFRSIFENAAAGMGVIAVDGRFLQVNQALCRFLGYSREELLGRGMLDVTSAEDRELILRLFEEVRGGRQQVFNFERRFLRKDGSIVWGQTTSAWLLDESFVPSYAVVLVQDITDRKQAVLGLQKALRETEAARKEIDAILRSVADPLVVTDDAGRITMMNRAAEEAFGARLSEAITRPLDNFIRDRFAESGSSVSLVKGGGKGPRLLELPGADPRHPRFFQARRSLFHDPAGRQAGLIVLFRDITREREIDRMKTDFISTAAHELRTPLTSILGFSQVLLDPEGLRSEEQREFLQYIHDRGLALAGIVSELLDIARIESGQGLVLQRFPCTPAEILNLMDPLMKTAGQGHLFEVALENQGVRLLVDKAKTGQVLENLLSNAIKYSSKGGRISISGQPTGGVYRFVVSDQGMGMSPDQVARVFDKFYRADASNTAIGGVGLGMSIVRYIVEAHGGKIWVESELGRGTAVFFTLPLASPELQSENQASRSGEE